MPEDIDDLLGGELGDEADKEAIVLIEDGYAEDLEDMFEVHFLLDWC